MSAFTFSSRRWRAALCSLSLALSVASTAHGQTSPAASEDEANAAISHGVALRQAGNDDEALAEFRRADQIFPSARAKAQIALAEQALGQWVSAERDLRAALALTDDPWIQRNHDALNAALVQISSRLGSLEVRTNAPGAELFINEERAASLPLTAPVRVPVGTVNIEVRANGYASQRRPVEVTPNGRLREVFTLVAARSDNDGSSTQSGSSSNGSSSSSGPSNTGNGNGGANIPIGPIVVMGAGAVSLGLAGMFGALRSSAMGNCEHNAAMDTLFCADSAATQRARAGVGYTTGVNVTLIGGAVLVAGGGAWLIASLLTRPSSRERASRVWVAPVANAIGAGISAGGRF